MRLYMHNCKSILAAMYPRQIGLDDRSYAAAPAQVSTVVTPPAPAAQNIGVKKKRGTSLQ
jgi:hypothetical protein